MGFILLMVPMGIVIYYLWPITFWLAQAFAGALGGIWLTMFYANGCVRQTAAFWHRTCPRWMLFIFGPPIRDDIQPMWVQHRLSKVLALISGVIGTIMFLFITTSDNYHMSFVIIYTTIWIIGIVVAERYFKRSYTQIKDWKDL